MLIISAAAAHDLRDFWPPLSHVKEPCSCCRNSNVVLKRVFFHTVGYLGTANQCTPNENGHICSCSQCGLTFGQSKEGKCIRTGGYKARANYHCMRWRWLLCISSHRSRVRLRKKQGCKTYERIHQHIQSFKSNLNKWGFFLLFIFPYISQCRFVAKVTLIFHYFLPAKSLRQRLQWFLFNALNSPVNFWIITYLVHPASLAYWGSYTISMCCSDHLKITM